MTEPDRSLARGLARLTSPRGLGGIRVLEVAGGVGVAWVAKLFADLGADVIRVEDDPCADVVRERPHDVHRWLNTNKRAVGAELGALVAGADLVVHGRPPGRAAASGLRYADLSARAPHLVVCSFTPFGMTGPYAEYAAEELTVIHGSSWGFLSPSGSDRPDLPPLKAPGHHATLNVGMVAATAALAAVERAQRCGMGEHVDVSIFAAAAKMTETAAASYTFVGEDASRLGVKSVLPWGIYACTDGLIQFICVEDAHWRRLGQLMGDPEWAAMDVFATNADRRANADLVELYVSEWMATQSVTDLCHDAQAVGICMTPVSTMAELDLDPQLAAREFFASTPDGLRVVGSGSRTDLGWWGLRRAAPTPAEHAGEEWLPRPPNPAPDVAAPARPLEGVVVCDFTWVWAGPYCTQLLAHLGAEVIRLESPEHACLFRRLPFNPAGVPLTADTAGVFHCYNTDKRSVRIDLRHPEAKDVVRRLVTLADVVVENFAVGTMDALGFGVDELRRVNPDVIVASLTGYGQTGPSASFMAYGPAGGAAAGLYAANGYENGVAAETGIAVGDPCTGITAAWTVVAALAARRRTGEVARIDVAMIEAVAATLGELWMDYLCTGESPGPAGNHDPLWSPHGCYPAAGEDRWVTIACPTEASWRALCDVVDPVLGDDDRFATTADRKANEPALDEALAAWTSGLDRWEVSRRLQSVGVAAFPSLSPADLWSGDPQLEALGMLERPAHPAVGERVVPGIPWRLTNGPNGLRRPAPLLGQHTDEVLRGLLGYTAAEVDHLVAVGAVGRPERAPSGHRDPVP